MRIQLRGRRRLPSPGFSSPRAVRGLTRKGLREVHVQNMKDLTGFDAKTQIIVFGNIGLRKKMTLLKICADKKYPVSQIKDISAFMQKVDADLVARKTKKKQSLEQNQKKAKETPEKKEEASPTEAKEETKKGEKTDKIKVLEKKQ
jgi:large subunit ribosomal protein L32e